MVYNTVSYNTAVFLTTVWRPPLVVQCNSSERFTVGHCSRSIAGPRDARQVTDYRQVRRSEALVTVRLNGVANINSSRVFIVMTPARTVTLRFLPQSSTPPYIWTWTRTCD